MSKSKADKAMSDFYVAGGTLQPDAPSYIERAADRELYERTRTGDFCYVLTPRQMGKSSLMARTAVRLKNEGIRTAIVDLTQIGTEKKKTSAGPWYYGIAHQIVKELGIDVSLTKWWGEREKLPALQRLTEFFSDVVLTGGGEPVVIFVDEIDTTIGLPYSDDFFAAIRACYNARATQPEYRRLSFVLLGVATPSQLIKDTRRTPFNIGRPIELTDFTFAEARPLAQCLAAEQDQGEETLERILYWTGGHPYLTQRLCRLAVGEKPALNGEAIDDLVEMHFVTPGVHQDDSNIQFVRDRVEKEKTYSRELLTVYRRILKGRFIEDEPLSISHALLKLSGLVVTADKRALRVRNRVYENIFTRDWVKEVMPIDWPRRISVASIIVLIFGFAIWYTQFLPKQYIERLCTAVDDVPVMEYNKLKRLPGFAGKADELFAQYWDQCALRAELQEKRAEGILYRLKALTVKDTSLRRAEPSRLLGSDYAKLVATYRHNKKVLTVAFSPDGKTILTGSNDGIAQLWHVDYAQPLTKPIKHGNSINAVAFSPDGKTILTGSDDGTARLWRAENGLPMGQPIKHGRSILAVTFSPDGKTILTGSDDRTARLWRTDNGQPLAEPIKHDGSVHAVAFIPDGKIILTGSGDGTARLWGADNGKPLVDPIKHGDWVRAVAISPDGKTILTGSDDGTARLWQTNTGKPLAEPMKHHSYVRTVAFSPDGKTILTGSDDGMARLWQANTGKPLAEPIKHECPLNTVAFSPNGKTIATGSDDGMVCLWQAYTGKSLGIIKHGRYISAVTFNSNAKVVLTGSVDGTAQLWQANDGQSLAKSIEGEQPVTAVAFSPNDKIIFIGYNNGTARLWQADTSKFIAGPIKHQGAVRAVSFSPDGKTVLIGSDDGMARLWSTRDGNPVTEIMKHTDLIRAVAFSPNGKIVFTGSYDGTARLWSADNGKPLVEPMNHQDLVRAVAFSPEGNTLLTGSRFGKLRLWRANNETLTAESIEYKSPVYQVAFSPDGKTVIAIMNWWIHRSIVHGKKILPQSSRILPGSSTGAYRFLDEHGDQLQVAVSFTGDSIKIITVRFDSPDAPPIQGDPRELLAEWQRKLALELKEDGKIVPLLPIEIP